MIKPASYWALHKTCDPITLGRVGVTLGGQTVDPPLNAAEMALVSVIRQDSEWMDERTEEQRARWKERQAKSRASRNVTVTTGDKAASRDVLQNHEPSVRPSVRPSLHDKHNNRSVPVHARTREGSGPNGTETGTGTGYKLMPGGIGEARKLAERFAAAASRDQGAFFSGEYDAVTICAAVTDDLGSLKRWRQLVVAKGESAVIEETFRFWREITAGEDVLNRGAALNERLGQLADKTETKK